MGSKEMCLLRIPVVKQKDGIWANISKQAVTVSKLITVLLVVLLWRTVNDQLVENPVTS